MWKSLKELGLPSKKGISSSSNIGLKINGALCFEKFNVTDKFNLFYTTVATNVVENLPKCVSSYGKQFVMSFYAEKVFYPKVLFYNCDKKNTVLKTLK